MTWLSVEEAMTQYTCDAWRQCDSKSCCHKGRHDKYADDGGCDATCPQHTTTCRPVTLRDYANGIFQAEPMDD